MQEQQLLTENEIKEHCGEALEKAEQKIIVGLQATLEQAGRIEDRAKDSSEMLKYAIEQLKKETRENFQDFDEIRNLKDRNCSVLAGLVHNIQANIEKKHLNDMQLKIKQLDTLLSGQVAKFDKSIHILDGIQAAQTSTYKEQKELKTAIDKEFSKQVPMDEFKQSIDQIKFDFKEALKSAEEKNQASQLTIANET